MKRDTLFSALKAVSNQAYYQSPAYIDSVVSDDLRMQLAAHIGKVAVKKTEHDHHVEFRIELIVATVDEFFEEVRKYAESEMRRLPIFLESAPKREVDEDLARAEIMAKKHGIDF